MIDGRKVNFVDYQDRQLWYITDSGFKFPIPLDEVCHFVAMPDNKSSFYDKYILKHLENLEKQNN